jgi:hypothetical protein
LRRALNLRVVSVIARTVRFPDGALCDRDGTPVAEQRWPDLFTAWYRHEYARPAANDDPSSTVLTKFWWLCGHLLAWPVTLPATQLVHTAMCQNPAWALGHTGDDAPGARWQRDLAQARPPDKSAKSAKSVKRNRVRNGAAPPDAPSG